MKIKELINYGKKLLSDNEIEDGSIVAKMLAQYILEMDKTQLVINSEKEIKEDEKTRYYLALMEVIKGMPVQYITNNQEFYGLDFYVDENVLIPQPDTETLVEEVINIVKKVSKEVKILDLCTGSGCIGIALNKNLENVKITMVDKSSKAIDIAQKNCNKLCGNLSNVKFIKSDMFEELEEEFDIIVSNPPYIETDIIKELNKQVQNEPLIALNGGSDGLDFYRILIEESHKYLSNEGYLCMEIGYNQKEKIMQLFNENKNYKNVYSKNDLSGNDRIIIAQRIN